MSKSKPQKHFADIFISNALLKHPGIKQSAQRARDDRGFFGADWPDWCYFPMAAVYALLTDQAPIKDGEINPRAYTVAEELPRVTAALIWGDFKGVYRFDETVLAELIEQPIEGDLPVDLFFRLPEPCVFIEADITFFSEKYGGFFAWLEHDVGDESPTGAELRLLFINKTGSSLSQPVILAGSIRDSIAALAESASRRSEMRIVNVDRLTEEIKGQLSAALNLVLYVCSDQPDITEDTIRSRRYSRTSNKESLPLKTWQVGVRLGTAIRQSRALSSDTGDGDRQQARPRPHVRRAHWHHYWTGAEGGERKRILKWVHPILVNVGNDEMPATIRPVE